MLHIDTYFIFDTNVNISTYESGYWSSEEVRTLRGHFASKWVEEEDWAKREEYLRSLDCVS